MPTPDDTLDQKICLCFHVSRRKLLNFLRIERPAVASMLSQCGGAGTGCGWCVPFLKQLHAAVKAGAVELNMLSPAEYSRRRAAYIRSGGGTPPPGATPLPDDGEHSEPEA